MKRMALTAACALTSGLVLAEPTAPIMPSVKDGSVKMTQDPQSGVATVEYETVDMDAITTFDVLTNGVSVGGAAVSCVIGDINKKVTPGKHTFVWRPDKSFPGHLFTEGNVKAVVKAWRTDDPPDYAVFFLDCTKHVRYYENEDALPDGGLTNLAYGNSRLVMRRIHAGWETYRMGSPSNEVGREPSSVKETQHDVSLSKDFYLGVYELTAGQYQRLTGATPDETPSGLESGAVPKCYLKFEDVRGTTKYWPKDASSVDANCLIDKIRTFFASAYAFDLPTEAQWEFACRAGCTAPFYNGGSVGSTSETKNTELEKIAWFYGNANSAPKRVGQLAPNAWGLYDMLGNAQEYCLDQLSATSGVDTDLGTVACEDPVGYAVSQTGTVVARGGYSWAASRFVRSAYRYAAGKGASNDYTGLRLALPLQ